jgi:hypothetical protein
MTNMLATITTEQETAVGETLSGILVQFGGAIEFWTLVCLSQNEFGDPAAFIDRQWNSLRERTQELRGLLSESDFEPSDAVFEQIGKLGKVSADLREVFDYFINAASVPQKELEAAVMRLAHIWQEVRMRVWLLGALISLPSPPALSMEKEAYYQATLDGLFDQFVMTHATGDIHERNGKIG